MMAQRLKGSSCHAQPFELEPHDVHGVGREQRYACCPDLYLIVISQYSNTVDYFSSHNITMNLKQGILFGYMLKKACVLVCLLLW